MIVKNKNKILLSIFFISAICLILILIRIKLFNFNIKDKPNRDIKEVSYNKLKNNNDRMFLVFYSSNNDVKFFHGYLDKSINKERYSEYIFTSKYADSYSVKIEGSRTSIHENNKLIADVPSNNIFITSETNYNEIEYKEAKEKINKSIKEMDTITDNIINDINSGVQ